MLKKKIKYTDYNGVEREDEFFFHLTKAELMEMEMGSKDGLSEIIQNVVKAKDTPTIIKIFKDLIIKSYGEKSVDGKIFTKTTDAGVPLGLRFSQTEAYSELFMELSTDADAAANFVKGIMPGGIDISDAQIEKIKQEVEQSDQ